MECLRLAVKCSLLSYNLTLPRRGKRNIMTPSSRVLSQDFISSFDNSRQSPGQ